MKRLVYIVTSLLLAVSLLASENMVAQTRSSNSSRSSSSSSSRSSSSQQSSRSSSSSSSSRSTGSGSSRTQSTQSSRSSGSSVRSSSSSSSSRSSGSSSAVQQQSRSSNSSGSSVRSSSSSSSSSRSSATSSSAVRSSSSSSGSSARSSNVSRDGLSASGSSSSSSSKETFKDQGGNYRYNDDMRVDNDHNLTRVAPRNRDMMGWDKPGNFWSDAPHYYGYRVHSLPSSWRRISHWGVDYYYYNGIYYRSWGGTYVVCRPPFGTPLEHAIDRAILRTIRFAYYVDTYRTFSRTFDYYNVIARQNLIIAQQNARIAQLNAAYALNSNRALTAYELAEKLGLVQSYAYAYSDYYYMDGVFYTISASGNYTTIVPPAGALVTSLPDDYEVIVMNGIEYYMVDNTVYRTTLFEGQPYLEVLGQMYGSLYSQYNIYR